MLKRGSVGIWSGAIRSGDAEEATDAAIELEELGYDTLWLPGRDDLPSGPRELLARVAALLAATRTLVVATSILSIWNHDPRELAETIADLRSTAGDRFVLGLGVSHSRRVDADEPGRYHAPIAAMNAFLDRLDEAGGPVGSSERLIAALAPRMLEISRDRAAGSHPYLVPPSHTRAARAILDDALLVPEQGVVLETDPTLARQIARTHLRPYTTFANYRANWTRHGFNEAEIEGGGSDRLVDALVAWGDEATIRARIDEHREAGADGICIQVLRTDPMSFPRQEWQRLAATMVSTDR